MPQLLPEICCERGRLREYEQPFTYYLTKKTRAIVPSEKLFLALRHCEERDFTIGGWHLETGDLLQEFVLKHTIADKYAFNEFTFIQNQGEVRLVITFGSHGSNATFLTTFNMNGDQQLEKPLTILDIINWKQSVNLY